jgi:hypothetical protein
MRLVRGSAQRAGIGEVLQLDAVLGKHGGQRQGDAAVEVSARPEVEPVDRILDLPMVESRPLNHGRRARERNDADTNGLRHRRHERFRGTLRRIEPTRLDIGGPHGRRHIDC